MNIVKRNDVVQGVIVPERSNTNALAFVAHLLSAMFWQIADRFARQEARIAVLESKTTTPAKPVGKPQIFTI